MPGLISDLLNFQSAGRAAKAVANSNIAAEHGVLDATKQGQASVENAVTSGQTGVTNAQQGGVGDVNAGVTGANNTLGQGFAGQTANLNPYLSAGQSGATGLQNYAASNPQFKFDASNIQNDPGYQFQLGQGTAAVNNSASAGGLLQSGNTLEALTNFGQGLAGTYLNNAYARQQGQFQTNQNATLANLSTLSGIGLGASQQFNNASQNNFNQQANNGLGAAYFSGNTGNQAAQFNAGLGVGGSEFNAGLGVGGATTAGNFGVDAGQATGAGILGQSNAVQGGLNDLTKATNPTGLIWGY